MTTRSVALLGFAGVVAALSVAVAAPGAAAGGSWPQWGGPSRNFVVDAGPLATRWPASGPRQLWSRPLGEGHSAIVTDGARLYTMYRPPVSASGQRSRQEVIAAFDPGTGRTLWEYAYAAPVDGLNLSEGAGPHSTPLLAGDRLFAMSSRVELFALDKAKGTLLWTHDFVKAFGAALDDRGYSPSPIAYRDMVIVPAGGKGSSVAAVDQASGTIRWRSGDFPLGPASPILISVDGQDQLVVSGADHMIGMSPADGAILWTHPHKTDWGLNISTPVWTAADRTLFVSAAYNNGSRLLQLTRADGTTAVRELWFQNRMRVHIGSVIRLGDIAVGSTGDFSAVTIAAIDLPTGQVLWQSRDFARSTFLRADGTLVVLDEDGHVGLATASRAGLTVLAKAAVLRTRAWTVPTLDGSTLYLRDRATMLALDLGQPPARLAPGNIF
jgi:outer membrane protein assembly factor BamB